jgi:peptide/nickel transport system permease protein
LIQNMPKIVVLWTDAVVLGLVLLLAWYVWSARGQPLLRARWHKVFSDAPALCSALLLGVFMAFTVLDSLHFRSALPSAPGAAVAYDTRTESVLDLLLQPLIDKREATYSAPLAYLGFVKESDLDEPDKPRAFPRLAHGGVHLTDPATQWQRDVWLRTAAGLGLGAVLGGLGVLPAWAWRRAGRCCAPTARPCRCARWALPGACWRC